MLTTSTTLLFPDSEPSSGAITDSFDDLARRPFLIHFPDKHVKFQSFFPGAQSESTMISREDRIRTLMSMPENPMDSLEPEVSYICLLHSVLLQPSG